MVLGAAAEEPEVDAETLEEAAGSHPVVVEDAAAVVALAVKDGDDAGSEVSVWVLE